MMMRYYWGFAIGHAYAHNRQSATSSSQGPTEEDDDDPSPNLNHPEGPDANTGDELEFSLQNLDNNIPADDSVEEDDLAASDLGDVNHNDYYDMYA